MVGGLSLGGIHLPGFGLGIHGLVYGVILGALLHLAIQVPGLIHFKFHWEAHLQLDHPGVRQVLRLLAEGLSNKAIAQQLSISDHTVKFHINAILGKLNAQSRTEAVVTAIRLGLIAV